MDRLTARQEEFCRRFHANGGNAKQAYIEAGYQSKTDAAAEAGGSRLMSRPDVKQRIDAMRAHGAAATGVTVERLTAELYDERAKAPRPGDRIRALELVGRLHGLFVDRAKVEKVETIGEALDRINEAAARDEAAPCRLP